MARETFINTKDDMQWLRDVHLPRLSKKFKSAILYGNEDYPDEIAVFEKRNPLYTDLAEIYRADADDVFRLVTRREGG